MKASGEAADKKLIWLSDKAGILNRHNQIDDLGHYFLFIERINSVKALIALAMCFSTFAKAFRRSTRVFTALTPFWRGKIKSFSDNPPLRIAGGFPDPQALTHELKLILSHKNSRKKLTLPIEYLIRRAL